MLVYLMRHGLAEDLQGEAGSSDSERPLSVDGTHRMQVQAGAFRRMVGILHEIWTSPLLRAHQTADIVSSAMLPTIPVCGVAGLGPEQEIEPVLHRLRQAEDDRHIVLIGHEVGLMELASHMLAGRATPMMKFPCGAVCCLDIVALDPIVRAQLHWFLTPRQLRALM